MKNIIFLLSLLLTFPLYCFDTLLLPYKVDFIQTTPNGTVVSNTATLHAKQGNYVYTLLNVPATVDARHLEIEEVDGVLILNIQLEKTPPKKPTSNKPNNLPLDSIYKQLKALETSKKEILAYQQEIFTEETKYLTLEKLPTYIENQSNYLATERQKIVDQLKSLQAQSQPTLLQWKESRTPLNSTKKTIYLSLAVMNDGLKTIRWNYLIPSARNTTSHLNENRKPNSHHIVREIPRLVTLHGNVIDQVLYAPLVFASVQLFQDGKLIQSTSTDFEGKFSLTLATQTKYDLHFTFEGYKKKKMKNIFITQAFVPEQTIVMKTKEKVSVIDIVAYTLPILDIARGFVK